MTLATTDSDILRKERAQFQAKIDGPENDGRQTASSSATLDYWFDMVEDITEELKRRGEE